MAKAIKDDKGFITGFEGEFHIFGNPTATALAAAQHNADLRRQLELKIVGGPEYAEVVVEIGREDTAEETPRDIKHAVRGDFYTDMYTKVKELGEEGEEQDRG